MNYTTLLVLLAAGMLLLFGCAGNAGNYGSQKQQTSEVGGQVQQTTDVSGNVQGPGSDLTDSDLALLEDSDSAVEFSDLPTDNGG